MTTQNERLKNAFFPVEGGGVDNVKFFLGSNRSVTAQQLIEQLDRAEAQIRAGTAVKSTKLDGELTTQTF